jgi:hypothetical protein
MPTQTQIAENAKKLRELQKRIHETFRLKPHGAEHHAACRDFDEHYDALAFPGGLYDVLKRLKDHDTTIVDDIISFLREDPQYFRSGYHKEEMLRRLKGFDLTTSQKNSLASLIIRSVENGPRRVFSAYAKLAAKLDLPAMEESIVQFSKSKNAEVGRRSRHILDILKARKIPRAKLAGRST